MRRTLHLYRARGADEVRAGLAALLLLLWPAAAAPAGAQAEGCRPELGGRNGARVTALLLEGPSDGSASSVSDPAPLSGSTEIEARSGQTIRLLVRPLEGSARPAGPECPVRVNIGRLESVGRPIGRGFVIDRGSAYGQFRPDEERALDFRVASFEDWDAALEKVEVENVTILLPETAELVARLPAPFRPPAGTVCADVLYADGEPATDVVLGLSAPPGGPTDRRTVGPEGRVCWDGFDESRYGDLRLADGAEPALGLPRSRYVSFEASYRLFVVKRQGPAGL